MTREETAAQHVRNAQQVLVAANDRATRTLCVYLTNEEYSQVMARLTRAVLMLENQSQSIG